MSRAQINFGRGGASNTGGETTIVSAILKVLDAIPGVVVWRNNVGLGKRRGHFIHMGAGKGSADILGFLPPDGRGFALEVKDPKARGKSGRRAAEHEERQRVWRERAARSGVLVGRVASVGEALGVLGLEVHA